MNFLAHMLLAGKNSEIRAGNFIADHVKGNQIDKFSPGIQDGIRHHREIDYFTDHHPVFKHTISVIRPELGHYSSVAADMFYDHFLAKQWSQYSNENRLAFTHRVYASLKPFYNVFPARSKTTYDYMTYRNWLYNYADIPFLNRCFRGLDSRATFQNNFPDATSILQDHYDVLKNDFSEFMPEIIKALAMTA